MQCRRPRLNLWVRKIPWRKQWQLTPVYLPGKSYGQRSPAGFSHGVARVRHNLATKPPPPCIYLHCDLYLHGFELLSSFLSFHLAELSWAFLGQVRSSGHKLPLVLFIWKCLDFLPPPPLFSFLIFTVLCSLQDFNSLTRDWTQTILVKAWDPNH